MQNLTLRGQDLRLHPYRAIYWRAQAALLLADLHLGKGAHFRKAGIPVPTAVAEDNFARLRQLLQEFQPARVLILGDLFHSDYNQVWETFCGFTHKHPDVSFELVPGNHDILPAAAYAQARLQLRPEVYVIENIALSHHPLSPEDLPPGTYNLHGHVHPGVRLVDAAGNGLKLPAFFFGRQAGILPAFGAFTGAVAVPVRRGERAFVLAEGQVIEVH